MMEVVLFLLFPSIFGCNGCKTICPSGNTQYALTGGTINLYPGQDSIHVGDTILVSSIIPVKLQPTQSGTSVGDSLDFSDASDMVTDLHFTSPKDTNVSSDALDSFQIIPLNRSIKVNSLIPHAGLTVQYIQEGTSYKLSFYMIAQKKGIYVFTIIDIFRAQKLCSVASIGIIVSDSDNHLHYLQDIYYGGSAIDPIDQTHSYCFKVY